MDHNDRQISKSFSRDGFVVGVEPVLSADLVARARDGMDRIRVGDYRTGVPPEPSPWTPGDPALMSRGGVSIHGPLTLHGSGHVESGLRRRSLAIHLCSEKSRPVREGENLARFLHDPAVCPVIHDAKGRASSPVDGVQ